MTIEPKPSTAPAKLRRPFSDLTTITAISFSLTFVGLSLALLAGILPNSVASPAMPIDMGVVLLLVPLCALVLAMTAEVLRAALTGVPRKTAPRSATPLSAWRPGHGEG